VGAPATVLIVSPSGFSEGVEPPRHAFPLTEEPPRSGGGRRPPFHRSLSPAVASWTRVSDRAGSCGARRRRIGRDPGGLRTSICRADASQPRHLHELARVRGLSGTLSLPSPQSL